MDTIRNDKTRTLKRGWTTGACATAAVKAALIGLWGDGQPREVSITLPKGEQPTFAITHWEMGKKTGQDPNENYCAAGIIKDAGDDPDVTHGALIIAKVQPHNQPTITFHAGEGVGTVTKAGLPIAVNEPAINPKPREFMREIVTEMAEIYGKPPHVAITISIPNGETIALKTWNPRLGIIGGLSVLGTTGIVRPFLLFGLDCVNPSRSGCRPRRRINPCRSLHGGDFGTHGTRPVHPARLRHAGYGRFFWRVAEIPRQTPRASFDDWRGYR